MSAHKKTGFTLVELLVVITIIAILSVIGMTVYSGVSLKTRDTARVALINDIKNALAQYNAANGKYPKTGPGGDVGTAQGNCANFTDWPQGGFAGLLNLLGSQGYLRGPIIDSGKDISCGHWNTSGSDSSYGWGDLGKGAQLGDNACGWDHCYIYGYVPWPAGYHYWSDGQSYKIILIKEDNTRYQIGQ